MHSFWYIRLAHYISILFYLLIFCCPTDQHLVLHYSLIREHVVLQSSMVLFFNLMSFFLIIKPLGNYLPIFIPFPSKWAHLTAGKLLIDAVDICILQILVKMHFPLRVVGEPRRPDRTWWTPLGVNLLFSSGALLLYLTAYCFIWLSVHVLV